MSSIDGAAIVLYFAFVAGVGFAQRRHARQTAESYYLGSRRIPWPLLALSGAVSNFDLTGTMWMVSVMVAFGMQSWWRHWMWGVALPAFGMAYMARWVRTSSALTGADWMVTRFGDDRGARAARNAYALAAVLFTSGSVAYAVQGLVKFVGFYLHTSPSRQVLAEMPPAGGPSAEAVIALAIVALTTAYVLAGGLFSVVATDAVQAIVLTAASVIIAGIAFAHATPETMTACVPPDFADCMPDWQLTGWRLAEHPAYSAFGWFTIAWVVKGSLTNAGGPAQMYDFQRYLAARTTRDACKLAAAWALFLTPRWALVMGIALLAKMSTSTAVDSEQLLPAIIREHLPDGLHGLVVAGLLAAFTTTLSATINSGAAYLVDLRPGARREPERQHRLGAVHFIATLALVAVGAAIGVAATSINVIWTWLQMSFISGLVIPNCLRWYWWRLNGWGYAAGVTTGSLCSLGLLVRNDLPEYESFGVLCVATTVACVVVSLATAPTAMPVLVEFYRTIRPFGAWRAVKRLSAGESAPTAGSAPPHGESTFRIFFNLAMSIVGLTALYLGPMYFVGHWFTEAAICAATVGLVALVLRFSWYPYLPADDARL